MDIKQIILLIQQLGAMTATIAALVDEARGVLSSNDEAALKAALEDIEKRNTAAYARVRAKLTQATGQG